MQQLVKALSVLALFSTLSTQGWSDEKTNEIKGAWKLAAIKVDNKETVVSGASFFFYSDGVVEIYEKNAAKVAGTYLVTKKKDQQHLDIILKANGKESVARFIYELKNETLNLGLGMKADSRPESFDAAKGTMIFKRVPGVNLK